MELEPHFKLHKNLWSHIYLFFSFFKWGSGRQSCASWCLMVVVCFSRPLGSSVELPEQPPAASSLTISSGADLLWGQSLPFISNSFFPFHSLLWGCPSAFSWSWLPCYRFWVLWLLCPAPGLFWAQPWLCSRWWSVNSVGQTLPGNYKTPVSQVIPPKPFVPPGIWSSESRSPHAGRVFRAAWP